MKDAFLLNIMKKSCVKKLVMFFVVILLAPGCGRKQKDIFHFPEKKIVVKVNKLSLPAVRGVTVTKTVEGNRISWRTVLGAEKFLVAKASINEAERELVGYDVYRLVKASIVPKKPLNKFVIQQTEFLDTQILEEDFIEPPPYYYIVRAIFKVSDQIVQGPASQVMCGG